MINTYLYWVNHWYESEIVLCFYSAIEHLKRWLIPEKVAISAEELEYLLRPSQSREAEEPSQTQTDEEQEGEQHNREEAETHSPDK